MTNILNNLKRYRFALMLFGLNLVLMVVVPEKGIDAFQITGSSILKVMTIIPPVFVLLGLLDVWVEREKIMRYMGPGSGTRGAILAYVLGSCAAGPLYVAFPIAGMLIKKGSSLFNIFIFIGAWSTTKLPMILFEASSIGLKYTVLRLILNTIGIVVIAHILERTTSETSQKSVYQAQKEI